MKLAVMQPYFFPYLGYFSLIKNTDRFIFLDSVQYIRHGWIERNRVRHPNAGWIYIRVPLIAHDHKTRICDIRIDNGQNWKKRILSQLGHYKNIAPYYDAVTGLLNELFENNYVTIVSLNRDAAIAVCHYLQIVTEFLVFSEMNLPIERPDAPDEWGLNICKALGNVTEFWNPPGGASFFDRNKFDRAGLGLKFLKVSLTPYEQNRASFEPGLSIIDVLMFNSPEEVSRMLDRYELL